MKYGDKEYLDDMNFGPHDGPDDTDGMTNWQAFVHHCGRFFRWLFK